PATRSERVPDSVILGDGKIRAILFPGQGVTRCNRNKPHSSDLQRINALPHPAAVHVGRRSHRRTDF
ncbi:MAG: hypothetical protein AAGB28_17685, partial [Pseudomonadota bacterium]